MSEKQQAATQSSFVRPGVLLAIRLLIFGAIVIACYLAWTSLSGGSVAGCGPESDCAEVLKSRWAYWFGIPVSLIALAVYAGVLFGSFGARATASRQQQRSAWLWLLPCAVMILAGALWFFSLQLFVIKSFCPYCLAAHALGTVAAVLILLNGPRAFAARNEESHQDALAGQVQRRVLVGVLGVGVLIAGQLVHRRKMYDVQPIAALQTNAFVASANTQSNAASAPPPKAAARSFPIYGMFQLDLYDVPLVGSPQARHILVSLFDYTCHHCRLMHPRLTAAQRDLSNHVAIVNLPMPLDPECNPTMTRPSPPHTNACQYARIGLAVWRARREAFEAYNHWFFEPERPLPLEAVRAYASELVGPNALENALQDPWVDQQLKTDVAIYEVAYRAGYGSMPQLIVGTNVYRGILSKEDLGRHLAQELWGQ